MNKKGVGAVIAVAGLAGALGVNLYSKYKLIKGDNAQDKDSEVSKEELDDFDIDEMFGNDTSESKEDPVVSEVNETEKESVDEKIPDVIIELLEEVGKTIEEEEKENVTELFPETDVKADDETKVEETEAKKIEITNEKDIDVESEEFWKEFNSDIEEPKK